MQEPIARENTKKTKKTPCSFSNHCVGGHKSSNFVPYFGSVCPTYKQAWAKTTPSVSGMELTPKRLRYIIIFTVQSYAYLLKIDHQTTYTSLSLCQMLDSSVFLAHTLPEIRFSIVNQYFSLQVVGNMSLGVIYGWLILQWRRKCCSTNSDMVICVYSQEKWCCAHK